MLRRYNLIRYPNHSNDTGWSTYRLQLYLEMCGDASSCCAELQRSLQLRQSSSSCNRQQQPHLECQSQSRHRDRGGIAGLLGSNKPQQKGRSLLRHRARLMRKLNRQVSMACCACCASYFEVCILDVDFCVACSIIMASCKQSCVVV